MIRAQASEGAAALRRRSDEDVDSHPRVVQGRDRPDQASESETPGSRRRAAAAARRRAHESRAVAIEDRVAEVDSTVAGYRLAMDAYFARLAAEEDPARLATMAEAMPDAPALEALGDLATNPVRCTERPGPTKPRAERGPQGGRPSRPGRARGRG